jgi:protein-S-isoprenylcysteine O-methyltransferase Ste14
MGTDGPLLVLATTICTYWGTVALLVLYKRLRHGGRAGLKPRRGFERRLWRLIVPVVGAWILLPLLAAQGWSWLAVPAWAQDLSAVYALRWAAAGLAVVCYGLSLYCWLLMGRNWSMAIVPGQTELVTRGLYRWVRHPIYALSITLMLASVVILPTVPLVVLAGLHLVAMNLKARHEEQHLEKTFGTSYTDYCRQVGRFWPHWSGEVRRSA